MKPYAVEVSFTMIVMAEDESDAYASAMDSANEAWRDTYDHDYDVLGPVRNEDDLKRHGWSGDSIPYGGDGETYLKTILASIEAEPDRDAKTIDMFAEPQ
jgi:hypothetical protein